MNCWCCGKELIWQGNYDFEDYGLKGDGVVIVLYCAECDTTWIGYYKLKGEKLNN